MKVYGDNYSLDDTFHKTIIFTRQRRRQRQRVYRTTSFRTTTTTSTTMLLLICSILSRQYNSIYNIKMIPFATLTTTTTAFHLHNNQYIQSVSKIIIRRRTPQLSSSLSSSSSAAAAAAAAVFSTSSPSKSTSNTKSSSDILISNHIIRISESVWRKAAQEHQTNIYNILKPGLTDLATHPINTGHQRQPIQRNNNIQWTALDPSNPIYNFLIEYYGIKGTKGVKRLARWSPGLYCHYHSSSNNNNNNNNHEDITSTNHNKTENGGGVLLEGANENDFASLLHLRGAIIEEDGILYCPQTYYSEKHNSMLSTDESERRDKLIRTVAPFLWYRAVLEQTLSAEPVLYCYGLHEWAMQYQPPHAPIPPSSKYQSHVPLRVTQDTLNRAVERVGTRCTHVDALRYFAPAAASLNFHGEQLYRMDQIRLEQPGCVHAHMDLLKIILKIEPFVDATLRQEVLDVAIMARKLDIGASPYDVTSTYQVEMIPIETEEGRVLYRQRQLELMKLVQPIRAKVLHAYNDFLSTTFTPDLMHDAAITPDPNERHTQTTPGGLPWRKNIIPS